MNSLILRTAARYLLPLLILFSIFLLFRGHNEPGGGFVAGLVAAAAFALYALAADVEGCSVCSTGGSACPDRVWVAFGAGRWDRSVLLRAGVSYRSLDLSETYRAWGKSKLAHRFSLISVSTWSSWE
jgi:L-alanine-DL-glutamate epimerase-like enolase superfamily enzyme